MAENSTKPKIRFKEFNDDWEHRELDSEVEFYSGLTYSPADVIKNGGTFVLRSSNVKNGEIINADDVFVNSDVVNSANVKKGDVIVVVRNGSRSLIGKHAQIKEEMDNTVIGAFMTGIRAEQSSFINALLDTPQYNKEIEKNLGATINQITTGAFKKMKFIFPEPKEQRALGDYFNSIDNLIKLHQLKYDKLVTIKKAMLEKMFPKNGSKVPEIRFKEFTDDWEEQELRKICTIRTGYPFNGNDFDKNGTYLVITNGNIQDEQSTVNNFVGNRINISDKKILDEYILNIGDILVTMDGTVGRTAKVADFKQILAQRVGRIIAEKNSEFLYHSLNTGLFFKEMSLISHGGTIKHISLSEIGNYLIKIPTSESEQQKIGAFFKDLDGLIALHQGKYDKLVNIKKAMLEKMFV